MDARTAAESRLAEIPLYDLGSEGPMGLVHRAPDRLDRVMKLGRREYGVVLLRIGDHFGRKWLRRNASPFGELIGDVARVSDRSGAVMLNLSYDFTCTTATAPDPERHGNRMLRTLDWPLKGLGREVVVARHEGAQGAYFDVTWPGFVGVATAMAPGRFSAAINQPPSRRHSASGWLDAAANKWIAWRQNAIPPVHLLRSVFDACGTFAEARERLTLTPISIPAIFTLSGTGPDEGCVIERTETQAKVHAAPASVANHWIDMPENGRDRGTDSRGRRSLMESLLDTAPGGFGWVRPPILNPTTRIAVVANAAAGVLSVRGYEPDGAGSAAAATADFALA